MRLLNKLTRALGFYSTEERERYLEKVEIVGSEFENRLKAQPSSNTISVCSATEDVEECSQPFDCELDDQQDPLNLILSSNPTPLQMHILGFLDSDN